MDRQINFLAMVKLSLLLLAAINIAWFLTACSALKCGEGAVEEDGVCRPANEFVKCGAGFKTMGNTCEPVDEWMARACGPNTIWNSALKKCEGIGGGSGNTDGGGGGISCEKMCQPAQGNKVCLSGKVFDGVSLLKALAEGKPASAATPIKPSDGAILKLYDPLAFADKPESTDPLDTTTIYNDGGCFIFDQEVIPYTTFFAVAVDDPDSSNDKWALAALGVTPIPGKNSTNLNIIAFTNEQVNKWGNDFMKYGTMVMWFRDKLTGFPIEGVKPIDNDKNELPTDKYKDIYYFNENMEIDSTLTATSKIGIVAVRGAKVENYSGKKGTCEIEAGTGGSAPNTLFFKDLDVENCQ